MLATILGCFFLLCLSSIVRMCGLKDKNSTSKSQRPSYACPLSSPSSNPMIPPELGVGLSLKSSVTGDLARIAPLTLEVVARRRTIEARTIGAIKGTVVESAQRVSSSTEGEGAAIYRISYDLELIVSKVTQV